jgi:hypothetical protein
MHQQEFRYVAADCSLRMAKTKFVCKKWSAALQHADVAMNCMKLLHDKADFSGLPVQKFALLPAVSPNSQDLPTSDFAPSRHI